MIFSKIINIEELITLEEFSFIGETVLFYEKKDSIEIPKGYASVYFRKEVLTINEMEMIEKGKGYGKQAVESFQTLFPDLKIIKGISLEESIHFWNQFNTTFFETCETCPLQDTEDCPLFDSGDVCDEYNENHFSIDVKNLNGSEL